MSSIDGATVLTMQGHGGLVLQARVEEITRPGVDGVAFGELGSRSRPVQVVTEVDSASAIATQAVYEGSVKKFVTVITPEGKTINHVFVHGVTVASKRLGANAGGTLSGAGAWLVTAAWTLQVSA